MPNITSFYRLKALFTRGKLRIGNGTKISHNADLSWRDGHLGIGRNSLLRAGIIVNAHRGHIEIGDNVSLNEYTILLGRGGISIGNDVRIASFVLIAAHDHNFDDPLQPIRLQGITKKPVVIEDDVWIAAGARILGGSHVAKGCVIGANAVVKGRTVPNGVYIGAPARLMKIRGGGQP